MSPENTLEAKAPVVDVGVRSSWPSSAQADAQPRWPNLPRSGPRPVVLIVDDEAETRKYVSLNLQARGFQVLTAGDGHEALRIFSQRPVNLVLLDITMPGPSGFDVCSNIRQHSNVPIIMLSASARESHKISALDQGADDYMTKPFGAGELIARVRAALRRSGNSFGPEERTHQFGDVIVDLVSRTVIKAGKDVKLSSTEFNLLALFLRNSGNVLTHQSILQEIWGSNYSEEREYLRAYVYRLRRKIEDDPRQPRYLLNVSGVGYRFAVESGGAAAASSGN